MLFRSAMAGASPSTFTLDWVTASVMMVETVDIVTWLLIVDVEKEELESVGRPTLVQRAHWGAKACPTKSGSYCRLVVGSFQHARNGNGIGNGVEAIDLHHPLRGSGLRQNVLLVLCIHRIFEHEIGRAHV